MSIAVTKSLILTCPCCQGLKAALQGRCGQQLRNCKSIYPGTGEKPPCKGCFVIAESTNPTAYFNVFGMAVGLRLARDSSSQVFPAWTTNPTGRALCLSPSHPTLTALCLSCFWIGFEKRAHKALFSPIITKQDAGFIPSWFILQASQGLKHLTGFCVFSCPLVIFHNRGCVSLLRSSAGNFTSLSCCCCRNLWPPACPQVLLLISYSTPQL